MTNVAEAKKTVKELRSGEPVVATKAAGKIIAEVGFKKVQKKPEPKTILVEMTPTVPKVTFTGEGWCAMDIKLAHAAVVRKFRVNLRELYRKEYKKK